MGIIDGIIISACAGGIVLAGTLGIAHVWTAIACRTWRMARRHALLAALDGALVTALTIVMVRTFQ